MSFSVLFPVGFELPEQHLRVLSRALKRGLTSFCCKDTHYRVFFVEKSKTYYVRCWGKFNKAFALKSD